MGSNPIGATKVNRYSVGVSAGLVGQRHCKAPAATNTAGLMNPSGMGNEPLTDALMRRCRSRELVAFGRGTRLTEAGDGDVLHIGLEAGSLADGFSELDEFVGRDRYCGSARVANQVLVALLFFEVIHRGVSNAGVADHPSRFENIEGSVHG